MEQESFKCDLVSWDYAYLLARDLASIIKRSGYKPDLVIAIGRGGYVPARVVCDFMMHSMLTSMKIEHWDVAAKKREEAKVRFPLSVDVRGLSVLIVDDVTDTGDTLKTALGYLDGMGVKEVRTGVLHHKTSSALEPDYYAEKVTSWRWIIYPWAAHEDLAGFAEKVLSIGPISAAEVGQELKRRYTLALDGSTLEGILSDLVALGKARQVGTLFKKPD